jgi:hypothetical protein
MLQRLLFSNKKSFSFSGSLPPSLKFNEKEIDLKPLMAAVTVNELRACMQKMFSKGPALLSKKYLHLH